MSVVIIKSDIDKYRELYEQTLWKKNIWKKFAETQDKYIKDLKKENQALKVLLKTELN